MPAIVVCALWWYLFRGARGFAIVHRRRRSLARNAAEHMGDKIIRFEELLLSAGSGRPPASAAD